MPPEYCQIRTSLGAQLQDLAPFIVSRQAAGRFLGYLTNQRQRLLGERGQKDVNRPDLVAEHGFDTKYACHMLRLGFQGIELMETGKIQLPMAQGPREWLLGVRKGQVGLQECLTRCGILEQTLSDLREHSPLPRRPDTQRVEEWMINVYLEQWKVRDEKWPSLRAYADEVQPD